MSEERYWVSTPQGREALPGTLKPSHLAPYVITPTLERARGYREVHDLSDGLPDPVVWTLTGEVWAASEAELSVLLRELRKLLRRATAIDRDGRQEQPLLGAHLLAVPVDGDSRRAALTVTVILAMVPDPDDDDTYDF